MPPELHRLAEIISTLRLRYWFLNSYYEAAWTESWSHRGCLHKHPTLIEAAKCAMPPGAGWYVFAVEGNTYHPAPGGMAHLAASISVGCLCRQPRWDQLSVQAAS